MHNRLIFLFFFLNLAARAQNRVLVFSNSDEFPAVQTHQNIEKFKAFAQKNGHEVLESRDMNDLKITNLLSFQAVILYHFDINKVDLQTSSALNAFFAAKGGLVGVHDIFPENPRWMWFSKIFEKKMGVKKEKTNVDILSILTLGGQALPPLWKLVDKHVMLQPIANIKKVVLMDFASQPLAWVTSTPLGNTCFYTTLGGTDAAFDNQNFLSHLLGGVAEVARKPEMSDSLLGLPKETFFHQKVLSAEVSDVAFMEVVSTNSLILKTNSEEVLRFDNLQKKMISMGRHLSLKGSVALTPDPEYAQNGFLYFYFPDGEQNMKIKRFRHWPGDSLTTDSFESQTSMLTTKQRYYDLQKWASTLYALPKYYDKKRFVLKADSQLYVESLDAAGELISDEPFVVNFTGDSLKAFVFNENGEMVFLTQKALKVLFYSPTLDFPPAVDWRWQIENPARPYLVKFSAFGVEEGHVENQVEVKYTWLLPNGVIKIGPEFSMDFKKPGRYKIILEATKASGGMAQEKIEGFVELFVPKKSPSKK
jgi:uncharacterized protein